MINDILDFNFELSIYYFRLPGSGRRLQGQTIKEIMS